MSQLDDFQAESESSLAQPFVLFRPSEVWTRLPHMGEGFLITQATDSKANFIQTHQHNFTDTPT